MFKFIKIFIFNKLMKIKNSIFSLTINYLNNFLIKRLFNFLKYNNKTFDPNKVIKINLK